MILIVDDDCIMLSILESIIVSKHHVCVTSDSLKSGQAILDAQYTICKAIICDHNIGEDSGFDLLMHAKSTAPTVPFILMSADSITDAGKKYPIQPDYFLPKPFTVESVHNLLNAIGITESE